jgi:hypothetical protein
MAEPGFFYALGGAREKLRPENHTHPGRSFFPRLTGRNDLFNAHVGNSGNQQGTIMRVIAGIISRPGRRPFMSTLKQAA